jgi:DNA-binding SARP family transcriptional activator
MAIERQHAARETFVGLGAMNAQMLASRGTDPVRDASDPIARLLIGLGEFLSALYSPAGAAQIDATAPALLAAISDTNLVSERPATLARLRLRAASALLGYAELKDSAAIRTQIDVVAADAEAALSEDDPDVIAWWAERAVIYCYALGREQISDTPLREMLDRQSRRLGGRTRVQSIAAFKWWRAHLELARYAGDVEAQDRALDGVASTIAPQRRAHLLTYLRVKAHVYVHRGLALDAERLARGALEVAAEIAAPASDMAAIDNVLALSLIMQERWAAAVDAMSLAEVRNHGNVARYLGAMRLLIESVAAWNEDRQHAIAVLLQGFARQRELLNYRYFAALPALAATLAGRALAQGIEVDFINEVVRRRDLLPPSHSQIDWPWQARLKLFGGFALSGTDSAARPGPKAQQRPVELLQALALMGPAGGDWREVSRRLYGSADAIAPVTLDMTVARARKLLGDDRLIVFDQGRLRLNAARVFVDVWAFEAIDAEIAAVTASDAPGDHLQDERRRLVKLMNALYAGPLLDGDPGDIASHTQEQKYRERFVANAIRLASALMAGGDAGEALDLLHRAIEREPDSEALYRALIEQLIERDELAEAKRWYERCETMTRQRFGVEVSRHTRVLLERMHAMPRVASKNARHRRSG